MKPLEGIKVIDFSQYYPGAFATLRLLDQGAEVIKVESPSGDPARQVDVWYEGGEGMNFRCNNRGKKSIVANLKDKNDLQKVLNLIKDADIVLESFRPGVTKKLGIDYDTLTKIKPDLIYASLTGFGQSGSLSSLASHDMNYMALSGFLDQLLDPNGNPIVPYHSISDTIGGIATSEKICAALVNRERTGQGVYLDIAMTDEMVFCVNLHIAQQSAYGTEHGCFDLGIGYGVFETKDKRHMTLGAMEDKFFVNFCTAVGREDLIPHQHTTPSPENPYLQELIDIFKGRTQQEWAEFAEKVDCCMSPVLRISELVNSVYIKERGLIQTTPDGLNFVTTVYRPEGVSLDTSYPKLGEHNPLLLKD
ncbi:MAG TPA: CaiB/BaiF CoA-transferase family protein [Syntrophomonas sp.]|nr:CaiB/BaiF CoA-transferase family protein [Syntrophomonas sp.]